MIIYQEACTGFYQPRAQLVCWDSYMWTTRWSWLSHNPATYTKQVYRKAQPFIKKVVSLPKAADNGYQMQHLRRYRKTWQHQSSTPTVQSRSTSRETGRVFSNNLTSSPAQSQDSTHQQLQYSTMWLKILPSRILLDWKPLTPSGTKRTRLASEQAPASYTRQLKS